MSDNYRLIEHNVELTKADNQTMPGKVIFRANEEGVEKVDQEAFWLNTSRWDANQKPETIVITVTAVIPTADPADEVEVFRSADSTELDPERNPSTTVASHD